jgi:transcriptional regulator with XRE-family HTH domain
MTFGRKGRRTPLVREQLEKLEDMRDDCIALFVNSKLTQKEIHERGGPTPGTISKWLYKETFFPRYATIDSFLRALGYALTPVPLGDLYQSAEVTRHERLGLPSNVVPLMPTKKGQRKG